MASSWCGDYGNNGQRQGNRSRRAQTRHLVREMHIIRVALLSLKTAVDKSFCGKDRIGNKLQFCKIVRLIYETLILLGPGNAGLCGGLEVEFLLCATNNLLPGRSTPRLGG